MSPWRGFGIAVVLTVTGCAGCGGDARVELSAAQSIDSVAAGLELAIHEYHGETEAADDRREDAVVAAFVSRVQAAAGDETATVRSAEEFTAALRKVRADRRVEWQRQSAALDNLTVLREIAAGLRRLAIDSLTLSDEVRRYLGTLVKPPAPAAPSPSFSRARAGSGQE